MGYFADVAMGGGYLAQQKKFRAPGEIGNAHMCSLVYIYPFLLLQKKSSGRQNDPCVSLLFPNGGYAKNLTWRFAPYNNTLS